MIKKYFFKGFTLTNRSLEIYLLGLVFLFIANARTYPLPSLISPVLVPISWLAILFSLGFNMSVPLFLTFKQEGKSLNFGSLWPVIWQNSKRMILPLLLILALILVLMILFFFLFGLTHYNANRLEWIDAFRTLINQISNWSLFLSLLAGLFIFSPIYFSIEKLNFWASLKKSFFFGLAHLNFIAFVTILLFSSNLLLLIIPSSFSLILYVISSYVVLIASASTLLFYQDNK